MEYNTRSPGRNFICSICWRPMKDSSYRIRDVYKRQIQATPENEAADTSGVQGTSEELRPAEESGSVAGQEQTAAVEPEADTTEPSGTKPARKRGGKKKQEEPAEGDAVLGESGGETSPEGTGEAEDAAEEAMDREAPEQPDGCLLYTSRCV